MITKLRVMEVDAKRTGDNPGKGFDVTFNFEESKVENDEVKIRFVYTANYKDNAGHITIKGELVSKEDKETIKKVEAEIKNKKLPVEYVQKVVNTINYFGTTQATMVASIMNMIPPIKMPNLQFKQAEEGAKPPAAAPSKPKK